MALSKQVQHSKAAACAMLQPLVSLTHPLRLIPLPIVPAFEFLAGGHACARKMDWGLHSSHSRHSAHKAHKAWVDSVCLSIAHVAAKQLPKAEPFCSVPP